MSLESKEQVAAKRFDSAAGYLSKLPSTRELSNDAKLELYGLYKLITLGSQPPPPRPSFFDLIGRAKWDAWANAWKIWSSTDGKIRNEEAQCRYLDLAESMGWARDSCQGKETGLGSSETDIGLKAVDLDRLDEDDDSFNQTDGHQTGMGNRVSILKPDETLSELHSTADTFHEYAAEGDLAALKAYLRANLDFDLDRRDSSGYTALHLASDRGHLQVVEVLLRANADVTLQDPDGFTCKQLAEQAGHEVIAMRLEL